MTRKAGRKNDAEKETGRCESHILHSSCVAQGYRANKMRVENTEKTVERHTNTEGFRKEHIGLSDYDTQRFLKLDSIALFVMSPFCSCL